MQAMLRSTTNLWDFRISATDGPLGGIKDLLFDDRDWITRYLVVNSSAWLPGRRVLIVPSAVGTPDQEARELPVELTKSQVKDSPSIDEDQPVSRERESELHLYYNWTPYWPGPGATPLAKTPRPPLEAAPENHLRSVREVTGYHIGAVDGDLGHVEEFIVDDETWELRYTVVDTRDWLPGRKVLVSNEWVQSVDWAQRTLRIDLTREQIKASPPYDPLAPVNRRYEERLYDFYGRPKYWLGEPASTPRR
jgi:hypothetical protein